MSFIYENRYLPVPPAIVEEWGYSRIIHGSFNSRELAVCDGKCHLAMGHEDRPTRRLSTEAENPDGWEDDWEYAADSEIEGKVPEEKLAANGKPQSPKQALNAWCLSNCERCSLHVKVGDKIRLRNFDKPVANARSSPNEHTIVGRWVDDTPTEQEKIRALGMTLNAVVIANEESGFINLIFTHHSRVLINYVVELLKGRITDDDYQKQREVVVEVPAPWKEDKKTNIVRD